MRTNIEIDDELMSKAMTVSGERTKRATVEAALRQFVRIEAQKRALKDMKGIGWDGDLDEMRRSRFADQEPW